MEVEERIRPFKNFDQENSDIKIVEGINSEKFVVVEELNLEKVRKDLEILKNEKKIDSVAIVLMHSYVYPNNE